MDPPTSTIMRSRVETLRPRNEDRKDITAVTSFDVLGGKMSLATEKRETKEGSAEGREGRRSRSTIESGREREDATYLTANPGSEPRTKSMPPIPLKVFSHNVQPASLFCPLGCTTTSLARDLDVQQLR